MKAAKPRTKRPATKWTVTRNRPLRIGPVIIRASCTTVLTITAREKVRRMRLTDLDESGGNSID